MLTARQLNAIHARAAAATPGPWEAHDCGDTCCQWITAHREDQEVAIPATENTRGRGTRADARFIAHARTDIPTLLAEINTLRAQLTETQQ